MNNTKQVHSLHLLLAWMKSSLKSNISTDSSRSLRLMFTKPSPNVREDIKAVYDTVDNHGVGAGMRLHPFASRQSFFKL